MTSPEAENRISLLKGEQYAARPPCFIVYKSSQILAEHIWVDEDAIFSISLAGDNEVTEASRVIYNLV
jgi:hypothetical protein